MKLLDNCFIADVEIHNKIVPSLIGLNIDKPYSSSRQDNLTVVRIARAKFCLVCIQAILPNVE